MVSHKEYQNALSVLKAYKQQCIEVIDEIDENINEYYVLRESKLFKSNLSVRIKNVLLGNNFGLNRDSLVKDLSNISMNDLLRCRNLGKKSLSDIKELCKLANVSMRQ